MLFAETSVTELGVVGLALTIMGGAVGWFLRVFVPGQQQAVATAETRTAGYIDKIMAAQATTLQARDALIEKLMGEDKLEREKDRQTRHDLSNKFQIAIAEMAKLQFEQGKQHIADAEKDRMAFLERNRSVESAIHAQTQQLMVALQGVCKFHPAKEKPQ